MILKPFNANLAEVMYADDKFLPLNKHDMARLIELIPDGDETFLTIRDNLYTEYVRAENQCGTIVVHRGIDSEPRKFPRGACVFFETSLPVVKWLICNYDCCEGDCDCQPVELVREVSPAGKVGQEWYGRMNFRGSLPIRFGLGEVPDWVHVETQDHIVEFSGTPRAKGSFGITVSATNCQGNNIVTETIKVVVE